MKLVTSLQMKECDRRTIAGENLPAPTEGLILMERAGWGIFVALEQHFTHLAQRPILILCGRGNNGGDGLVLARLLHERGLQPRAWLLADPAALSSDAAVQADRCWALGCPVEVLADAEAVAERLASELRTATRYPPLVVDALLGTGSRGAPRGVIGAAVSMIEHLRAEHEAEILAVDLPTGVNADTGEVEGEAVRAEVTVTMAYMKVGFVLHPARSYLGRVRVVDIGIPPDVEEDVGLPISLLTAREASRLRPARAPQAHKGQVGRVLITGGSPGLSGAPALAAEAALRTGSGLVTVAVPEGLNVALEAKLTEAMTLPCPETPTGGLSMAAAETVLGRRSTTDVWVIGPGLGRQADSLALARHLVGKAHGPLVVDADGLTALAEGTSWWRHEEDPPPVLTPHPGEMARLLGCDRLSANDRPWEIALRYAAEKRCVLVLKGAPTFVASPDGEVTINPTGNAGMATGGSGDALTGVIASLLGQGLGPAEAARLGVYLHGHAGDRALARTGPAGLLPRDLIEALPDAWRDLDDPSRLRP